MEIIPAWISEPINKMVDLFTLGQLQTLTKMFNEFSGVYKVDAISMGFASLIVLIKIIVPCIITYAVINKFARRIYALVSAILVFVGYMIFYADPITLYERVSKGTAKFLVFLGNLSQYGHVNLNNILPIFPDMVLKLGVAEFIIRAVISFAGVWVLFAVILGLATLVIWIMTLANNPWKCTPRAWKQMAFLMAMAFMLFYPIFGATKAIISVLAIVVGGINIVDGLHCTRGKQKQCFRSDDGSTICDWR